nr:uncharacterized protein LOC113723296 [Coffea arabica]XP_027102272.1 uncharacterized protein LOC113723303 [Coffea arabica]
MAGSGERLRQSNEKQSKRGNLERDFGRQNQRKHEVLDTQDFDFQLLKLNEAAPSAAVSQPEPLINCFSTCVSSGDDLSSDGSGDFQLTRPSPSSSDIHHHHLPIFVEQVLIFV